MGYLLGFDIGSSSIKATLMETSTGNVIISTYSPKTEMSISAPKPGWAEQQPETWWEYLKLTVAEMKASFPNQLQDVDAIGISYQMHGLVLVDKKQQVIRPSIIWCDSRAVSIGEKAFQEIGETECLQRFLNSPGNFTASKLKWVQENEPQNYAKIFKMMLPGDYIAMKLTGEIQTTVSGLSEGILWDFPHGQLAQRLLDYYEITTDFIPELIPTFAVQGELTKKAAEELGLKSGIKISYRAGDQPNNAFSLNVLRPGELAATAGTSGVVYGVGDQPNYDPKSRVNTFVHVNHSPHEPRYGILLCLNGTGILNRWMKNTFATELTYQQMNDLAAAAPPGAKSLFIFPYGNGAERTLENRNIGASVHRLDLNIHNQGDILRATQEGIVFALHYGLEIMKGIGVQINTIKAGHANMFLSPIFTEVFAAITGAQIELYNTDGSQGAARGAGLGANIYKNEQEAFVGLSSLKTIQPDHCLKETYQNVYQEWLQILLKQL